MQLDPLFIVTAFFEILKALPLTLVISIVPLLFGFVIGTGIALIRIYKVRGIHHLASFYVSFIRGTPLLLHIMIIYFGLPLLFDTLAASYGWGVRSSSIPLMTFVLVAFSVNSGAYMSEAIRSGILSVDHGQLEGAYSVGMTRWQGMRRIVLPQALMASLPNLLHKFVGLLHGSSLAFTISLEEINGRANIIATSNLKFLEAFIAAAFIYWGLTLLAEGIAALLERRLNLYNRGGIA
ncbi:MULTISPECIES: amino acid ABC transporter permease [Paenibacillus]|uniref:amino acid ABC transporter permease n=1 Tax=Paenibacillus TaxID=44249 RepID=UPI0022B8E927|nr:amino acid ABC transporter permease [Paenibacillus caseinilyticus]MCZ8521710.1 amino acid ABC transporter permease [Paenibacillus caseinilyticus]